MNIGRFFLRIIIPAFANFNIYSRIARTTTALGPVIVATIASKLLDWDVEVVDENNCRSRFCPKDPLGRPDHLALQRERPADVVGFYGSLTSTAPRLYELSALYKKMGVFTIAGGKHVENLPREALENSVDIVVFGEGERAIQRILLAFEAYSDEDYGESMPISAKYGSIRGIGFMKEEVVVITKPQDLITDFDEWPFPDFSLVRYAKIKTYPVSGTRGCDSHCEFCAVKDRTRCATPCRMMAQIAYLVEVHGARKFFETSDHFAADRHQAMEFCCLLTEYQRRKGVKLAFTVQIRLTDAKYPELLEAMKAAGVDLVCIGIESPIDEELIAMKKGYNAKNMVKWAHEFHRHGFKIHGMFIFGYPRQDKQEKISLSLDERIKRFRKFIHEARIDTCQVLLAIPLPGTELYARLDAQGRIFPREQIGWERYDGNFPIFLPDDDVDPADLQNAVTRIMGRFYHFHHILLTVITCFYFPVFLFPSSLTLVTLRVRYLTSVFAWWKRTFWRNPAIRSGGWFIVRGWTKKFRESDFPERLRKAVSSLKRK